MWQLIVHEVLLKRKVALDQFSAGLKVLGVHELLMHHSKVMEPYFVAKEQTLSAKAVVGLFEDISKQQSDGKKEQARQFFVKAITDLDVEGLVIINFENQYFIDTVIVCLLLKNMFLMNPSSLSHARASCSPCPQICLSLSDTLHHSTNITRYWGFTVL